MKYTTLGRTGLRVSRLCLGTMAFGSKCDEREAFRIMDVAMESGINFFDTSNNYGQGEAERIVGKWFSQGSRRREKTILATKVHEVMNDPDLGPNDVQGLSTFKMRRHLEDSLRRLATDHVEIYYMHHIDRHVSMDELWDSYQRLFLQGKVDYVGSSNFPAWYLSAMQAKAAERHLLGIAVEQHVYHLMGRLPELEVIPCVAAHRIGLVTWSPLNSGVLSRAVIGQIDRPPSADKRQTLAQRHRFALQGLAVLAEELGEPEEVVALAWQLSNPAITAPIIGPRSVDQLETVLRAAEVSLTDQNLKVLDSLFPPIGRAPEAYAW